MSEWSITTPILQMMKLRHTWLILTKFKDL